MKTKDGKNRCQVSGAKCQEVSPKSIFRSQPNCHAFFGGAILTPDSHLLPSKIKEHPEMLMKTKEGGKQVSGARCHEVSPRPSVRSQQDRLCRLSGAAILFPHV